MGHDLYQTAREPQQAEQQDDSMGGLEQSQTPTPQSGHDVRHQQSQSDPSGHEFRHQQSQSDPSAFQSSYQPQQQLYEQQMNADPAEPRFPAPQAPANNIPRPTSGLSGGGDRYGNMGTTYQEQNSRGSSTAATDTGRNKNSVVIKVGMVGDAQIGKTSLMVKYVEGSWDEDYIQTLGVNFMEKTISIRNTEITFSIWDLGGQREFVNMLPLVCNDAVAILFMFDLTRKSTLNSIKEWYRQGRGFNKTAIPFLVGTKYDHFVNFPREDQEEISNQARRFAKAMRASLIFSSTSHSINVQKIFKIVLSKAFDLKCTIPEIENIGEPLLIYQSVG
ncbi:hypothetical protein VE01_03242 [Pseudogymnoascus verrucosus]|uniref:Septum-promoting GTP-binding protein 1 n=1 Tax=Pseudogymnoascus verrucosus TaxID=342668 RepID=A0A1B8GSG1_9PEZI|nr:uncharacterized protein VE01_03242 [Pseudogymnoascus verrucosus]OBT98769.1 hypothetical protein VE01_03242 [Pseudogymnoascus verrucosus]